MALRRLAILHHPSRIRGLNGCGRAPFRPGSRQGRGVIRNSLASVLALLHNPIQAQHGQSVGVFGDQILLCQ